MKSVFRKITSLYINVDGSSKNSEAGIGIVIKDNYGRILEKYNQKLGKVTSNFAEYKAVKKALELALKWCRDKVYIFSDSKLFVNQINGKFRIRNEKLLDLLKEIKILEKFFRKVKYFWIERKRNKEADKLAKSEIKYS